jgi:hypothetical protein
MNTNFDPFVLLSFKSILTNVDVPTVSAAGGGGDDDDANCCCCSSI